jgi:diadenosine tetraphosphate (Ap4A) HIT family hydrolase
MPCVIRRYNPKLKMNKDKLMADFIFCKNLPKVIENDLAYAVYDINPKAPGHILLVTKRHHVMIFDSTLEEVGALFDLVNQAKDLITKEFKPQGFNIVVNCGEAAGQVVMHTHVHLIPKYA